MAVNDTPTSANDERKQKNQKKTKKHKKAKSKQAIVKNVRRIHYDPLLLLILSGLNFSYLVLILPIL